jgi:hypothetical protein
VSSRKWLDTPPQRFMLAHLAPSRSQPNSNRPRRLEGSTSQVDPTRSRSS